METGFTGSMQELKYENILFFHLDRLSKLVAYVPSPPLPGMEGTIYSRTELNESYYRAMRFFRALVPESLKDKKYNDLINELNIEVNASKKRNPEYPVPVVYTDEYLAVVINLLDRRGLLLSRKIPSSKSLKMNDEDSEE